MSEQLMTKYDGVQDDYNKLRTTVINNIEIENILSGVSDEVNAIFDMSEEVDRMLVDIEDTDVLSNTDLTDKELLDALVSPAQYRLSNLNKVTKEMAKGGYEALGMEIGVMLAIPAISSGFKSIKSFYNTFTQQAGNAFSKLMKTFSIKFTSMYTKTAAFFGDFRNNVKKMTTTGFKNFKAKISNPKGVVKNYVTGISGVNTLWNTMGAAAGAVVIWMGDKQYRTVAEKISEALDQFKQYETELREQVLIANNQTETISDMLDQNLVVFNDIVNSFADGLSDNAENQTELFDNLETDLNPDNTVDLLRQQTATLDTIIAQQAAVLAIVNDTKFEMETYSGWIRALNLIVTATLNGVTEGKSVQEILSLAQNAFQYQEDSVKQFSDLITLESLICCLTYTETDQASYRTFPLESIRSTCIDGNPETLSTSYITEHKELAKTFLITEEYDRQAAVRADTSADVCDIGWDPPQCTGSVTDVVDAISTFVAEDTLMTDADVPDQRAVLCKIAAQYPTDATFAFWDLANFRINNDPDCSTMSDDDLMYNGWDAEDAQYECERNAKRAVRDQCRSG